MSLIETTIEINLIIDDPAPIVVRIKNEDPIIPLSVDLDNFADLSNIGGIPIKFGQVGRTVIFSKVVSGKKTTFGQVSRSTTFLKSVSGSVGSSDPTVYSSGGYGSGTYGDPTPVTKYGQVSLSVNAAINTSGVIPTDDPDTYSGGTYGSGTYGDVTSVLYGDELYGDGTYG